MLKTAAKLIRQARPGQPGQEFSLMDDITTLGRAMTCQVVI
jgi:hypothetical protein